MSQKARIKVKPDTPPVFIKAKPVSFARKSKVEKELENLAAQGITEKVEHRDGLHPLLHLRKLLEM